MEGKDRLRAARAPSFLSFRLPPPPPPSHFLYRWRPTTSSGYKLEWDGVLLLVAEEKGLCLFPPFYPPLVLLAFRAPFTQCHAVPGRYDGHPRGSFYVFTVGWEHMTGTTKEMTTATVSFLLSQFRPKKVGRVLSVCRGQMWQQARLVIGRIFLRVSSFLSPCSRTGMSTKNAAPAH